MPVTWTTVVIILLCLPGKMLPDEQNFKLPFFDKLVHIGLFGGMVLSWGLYYSVRHIPVSRLLKIFFLVFICGAVLGAGMEFVQKYFIPNRDFDEADIIADFIGAGIAYGICNIGLLQNNDEDLH